MTIYQTEMLTEADRKRRAAMLADEAGDATLRNAFLEQAADRYRAAGLDRTARRCERFMGTPAGM